MDRTRKIVITMTSNEDFLKQYMVDLGLPLTMEEAQNSDLFFDIQLIRRGKDHPELPAANYTFNTYYITSIEKFDRVFGEIKQCCDMFWLRAYISVNAKSKQEATKKTCERYAHNIVTNDYRSPWRALPSVCGSLEGKDKRWIVDIDNKEDFDAVASIIRKCRSAHDNPIVCGIPTKSGYHIITHPFNLQEFRTICNEEGIEVPEVKKNHITLLYENV